MNIYPYHIIFTIIILLPNVTFIFFPPKDKISDVKVPKIYEILERVGQIGIFLLPLFYTINWNYLKSPIIMVLLVLSIVIYYSGWLRYILNREWKYLYLPMLHIIIPLAISPIIYYLIVSFILESWVLFLSTTLFAIGHIKISYKMYNN